MLQQKERMAETRAAEFRATLQTKDEQLSKFTPESTTVSFEFKGIIKKQKLLKQILKT